MFFSSKNRPIYLTIQALFSVLFLTVESSLFLETNLVYHMLFLIFHLSFRWCSIIIMQFISSATTKNKDFIIVTLIQLPQEMCLLEVPLTSTFFLRLDSMLQDKNKVFLGLTKRKSKCCLELQKLDKKWKWSSGSQKWRGRTNNVSIFNMVYVIWWRSCPCRKICWNNSNIKLILFALNGISLDKFIYYSWNLVCKKYQQL